MDKAQANDILISEMCIPRSLRNTVFNVVFCSIVMFFVLLATISLFFLNYLPIVSIIASIIWLIFIFFQVRSSCGYVGGVRQFMIKIAGIFAPYQFAEIGRHDKGENLFGSVFKKFLL